MEFRTFDIEGPIELSAEEIRRRTWLLLRDIAARTVRRARRAGRVRAGQSVAERSAGTIRGIHFQTHPRAQGKLVRCSAGSVARRRGRPATGFTDLRQVDLGRSHRRKDQSALDSGRFRSRLLHARAEFDHQLPGDRLLQSRTRQGRRVGRSRHWHRLAGRRRSRNLVGQGSGAAARLPSLPPIFR